MDWTYQDELKYKQERYKACTTDEGRRLTLESIKYICLCIQNEINKGKSAKPVKWTEEDTPYCPYCKNKNVTIWDDPDGPTGHCHSCKKDW